jgi:hypothetical protein
LFALPVHAEVLISEIAWMGYQGDANNEWIELYNSSSSSVDLSGWVLVASDGSPSITLSGSIGALSYFLLERTDDASVPGVSANLIYAGALGNTGETLILKNKNGVSVDTVTGGTGWENIGGDVLTGETPQRTAQGTWITAAPTPKSGTVTQSISTQQTTVPQISTQESQGSQTVQMGTLYLDVPYTMTIISGADTLFEVTAYDDEGRQSERGVYRWNFGNGVVKTGNRVYYAYTIPGEYTATISVLDGFAAGDAQIDVTVLPPQVYVGRMTEEALYIENRGTYDADLSAWKVRQTNQNGEVKELSFPPYTFLRAGHEVPLAHIDTGFIPGFPVKLLYPNGKEVEYEGREKGITYAFIGESVPIQTSVPAPVVTRERVSPQDQQEPVSDGVLMEPITTPNPLPLAAAATQSTFSFSTYTILWIVLTLGGLVFLVIIRRYGKNG